MSRKTTRLKNRLRIEQQRRSSMSEADRKQFDQLQQRLSTVLSELAEANRRIARIGKLEGFNGVVRSEGPIRYGGMKAYTMTWNPEQIMRGLLYSQRPSNINDVGETLRYLTQELAHKAMDDIRKDMAASGMVL